MRGVEAVKALTEEEEVGFMLLADAIQALQHLRDAFTAKGNG